MGWIAAHFIGFQNKLGKLNERHWCTLQLICLKKNGRVNISCKTNGKMICISTWLSKIYFHGITNIFIVRVANNKMKFLSKTQNQMKFVLCITQLKRNCKNSTKVYNTPIIPQGELKRFRKDLTIYAWVCAMCSFFYNICFNSWQMF